MFGRLREMLDCLLTSQLDYRIVPNLAISKILSRENNRVRIVQVCREEVVNGVLQSKGLFVSVHSSFLCMFLGGM